MVLMVCLILLTNIWAFPLIEAVGLSAYTAQALSTAITPSFPRPVSASIPNAGLWLIKQYVNKSSPLERVIAHHKTVLKFMYV